MTTEELKKVKEYLYSKDTEYSGRVLGGIAGGSAGILLGKKLNDRFNKKNIGNYHKAHNSFMSNLSPNQKRLRKKLEYYNDKYDEATTKEEESKYRRLSDEIESKLDESIDDNQKAEKSRIEKLGKSMRNRGVLALSSGLAIGAVSGRYIGGKAEDSVSRLAHKLRKR